MNKITETLNQVQTKAIYIVNVNNFIKIWSRRSYEIWLLISSVWKKKSAGHNVDKRPTGLNGRLSAIA